MAPGRDLKSERGPGHYAIEQWIDFARGVTPADEAARMTKHAGRCSACRDCMQFWMKVTAATRSLSTNRG